MRRASSQQLVLALLLQCVSVLTSLLASAGGKECDPSKHQLVAQHAQRATCQAAEGVSQGSIEQSQ